MKFSIIDDDSFDVYVNNKYLDFNNADEENLYDYLKKILINIRKKYAMDIFGFFEVDIYKIGNIGTLLKFNKKDDDDFIYKTVDLKVVEHDTEDVYLKFNDYFLIKDYKKIKYFGNNYYINAKSIANDDINRLLEFFDISTDERLADISYI